MDLIIELKRKAFHQLSLLIPLGYLIFPKTLALQILLPLTITITVADIARFYVPRVNKLFVRYFGKLMRDHENSRLTGSTNLLWGAVISIWLFPKSYAILGLLFLIISDSVAALIGKKYGRHKLFNKSLEGSSAFLVSSLLISLFFPSLSILQRIIAATIAAFFELLPIPVDDNFLIPVITCLALSLYP